MHRPTFGRLIYFILYKLVNDIQILFPTGHLADKFNSYKLFLICLVSCSAVFHTMLMLVDAKVSGITPLVRLLDASPAEVQAELFCNRAGSRLTFENLNCTPESALMSNWSGALVPSRCRILHPCPSQIMPMRLCFNNDNCTTQIATSSTSELEMEFQIFVIENQVNCSAWIDEIHIDQASSWSATLLCSCPVKCPITVKSLPDLAAAGQLVEDDFNWTLSSSNQHEKHKAAFAMYFLLRIGASSSLAAALSM